MGLKYLLIRNMVPVSEAYFGKTPNLIKAEKILAKIIKEYKVPLEKVGKRRVDVAKFNSSPLNIELQNLFIEEFGFKEMVIHWNGDIKVNALTLPKSFVKTFNGSMPLMPKKQADGKYYDSYHSYLCVIEINMGIIDIGCTPEELMAVILHEIGHCFECTPVTVATSVLDYAMIPLLFYQYFKSLEIAATAVGWLADPAKVMMFKHSRLIIAAFRYFKLSFSVMKKAVHLTVAKYFENDLPEMFKEEFKKFDQWLIKHQDKVIQKWNKYLKERKKEDKDAKHNINISEALHVLDILDDILYFGPVAYAYDGYRAMTGYSGEVFADSFATAYGYGPGFNSFQNKVDKYKFKRNVETKVYSKSNYFLIFNQYINCMFGFLAYIMDPHPMDQTRMKNQCDKLRKELQNEEIPYKLRESIEKDLERCEKEYQEYLKLPPAFRYLSIIINFRTINETYFNGRMDFRDFLNRLMNFGKAEA